LVVIKKLLVKIYKNGNINMCEYQELINIQIS
jgi:hypothetical protein